VGTAQPREAERRRRPLSLPSYLPSVYGNERTNVKMSFGFSVGDFLAVIELANKIRKEFVDAPSQFKDISDECVFSHQCCIYELVLTL
jgi:hypothetical protein